jgi:hypothetical protein
VVLLAAVTAAGAYATTVTGTQNPQFRVSVSITPAHPVVGQTVVAHFSVRNMTTHTLKGQWGFTWSTPQSGIGSAIAGTLRPGRLGSETLREKITAKTPKGSFTIAAEASDGRGRSHASARVTYP